MTREQLENNNRKTGERQENNWRIHKKLRERETTGEQPENDCGTIRERQENDKRTTGEQPENDCGTTREQLENDKRMTGEQQVNDRRTTGE
ncbi:hypothetical protein JOB18_014957 [Solea senegalensis]|uniref:Uncharacterized protein n=1 Tax=Solea senegalensis TaxID=28829 RepID=A0AAV6PED5_SOLSE|nr:hypothetical protein JOB18_014957 [Solea senegalensis]